MSFFDINVSDDSFSAGPIVVPWTDVNGAGVGVRPVIRPGQTARVLLISYNARSQQRTMMKDLSGQSARLDKEFEAKLGARWRGEDYMRPMRKRLGMKTPKALYAIFAIAAAVTAVLIIGAVSKSHTPGSMQVPHSRAVR